MKGEITQNRLKEILHYDPNTGVFVWVEARGSVKIGKRAGTLKTTGYISIVIDRNLYFAHRLAWLYIEGFTPHNIEIDHINRDRSDNRWSNLRLASRLCNIRNSGIMNTNKSGVTGVSWDKRERKWTAHISLKNINRHLGNYSDFDNAVLARLTAELCLNWSKCTSNSIAYNYSKSKGLIK